MLDTKTWRAFAQPSLDEAMHQPDGLKVGVDSNWTVFVEELKRGWRCSQGAAIWFLKSCAMLQQCKKFDTLLPHASGVWTRRGFSQDFG
jgi:hypothetical protein